MKRRLPLSDAPAARALTVARNTAQSLRQAGPLFTCTRCGEAKPSEAYARWGLGGTRWSALLGTHCACDACLDEVTRFPADMPMPVMLVESSVQSDDPAVWRLTA